MIWCSTTRTVQGFVSMRQSIAPSFPYVRLRDIDTGHDDSIVGARFLLSFDLDDTLFPTSQVVNEANTVMIAAMNALGYAISVDGFLETTRRIRKRLTQPVTYTVLRKMAIREVIQCQLSQGDTRGPILIEEKAIDELFNVWLEERHAAAERYLFPDVIPMLQSVRARFPGVCIAAITNGRGDPLAMKDTLAPYFEFCVSGEDSNVFPDRKPHLGIYEAALALYNATFRDQSSEELLWCHVGDCLANDVGASAGCGAFAVWFCPDDQTIESAASRLKDIRSMPSWSTASAADIVERAKMADHAKEKVATRIRSLSELDETLLKFVERSHSLASAT